MLSTIYKKAKQRSDENFHGRWGTFRKGYTVPYIPEMWPWPYHHHKGLRGGHRPWNLVRRHRESCAEELSGMLLLNAIAAL